jgi:hypothetical protein
VSPDLARLRGVVEVPGKSCLPPQNDNNRRHGAKRASGGMRQKRRGARLRLYRGATMSGIPSLAIGRVPAEYVIDIPDWNPTPLNKLLCSHWGTASKLAGQKSRCS